MMKRILLYILTNVAVLVVISIVFMIVEKVFWIPLSTYSWWYVSMIISASIIGFIWSFTSLLLSKWMAKRAYSIEIINETNLYSLWEKQRFVFNLVKDIAQRNNIKTPEFGIYESQDPNAFATWASKNSSLVAVSTGLLNNMDNHEIEGVIWHEMAHILNWDMITMALLQGVLNTFVIFISNFLANMIENFLDEKMSFIARFVIVIIFEILLWILASLIAMSFSRYREFRADEWSAKMLWKDKMIAWLKALKRMQNLASEDQWSLASMKISTKSKWWIMAFFSSHPDLDDRILALENLVIR